MRRPVQVELQVLPDLVGRSLHVDLIGREGEAVQPPFGPDDGRGVNEGNAGSPGNHSARVDDLEDAGHSPPSDRRSMDWKLLRSWPLLKVIPPLNVMLRLLSVDCGLTTTRSPELTMMGKLSFGKPGGTIILSPCWPKPAFTVCCLGVFAPPNAAMAARTSRYHLCTLPPKASESRVADLHEFASPAETATAAASTRAPASFPTMELLRL